jgi:internalin A
VNVCNVKPQNSKERQRHAGRWRQFSLRMLVALFVLLAPFLGFSFRWLWLATRRADVAEKLQMTGAGIERDAQGTVLSVRVNGARFGDEQIAHLGNFSALRTLIACDSQVTDVGLVGIRELTVLEELYLDGNGISDTALAHAVRLRKLRQVSLRDTRVTGAGLRYLRHAKGLVVLHLRHCPVTDAGLEAIAGLGSLKTLDLSRTQITDAGLKHLAGLAELESLDLSDTNVSDAGLRHLQALTKLCSLDLTGTHVTGVGLAHLVGTNLQALALADTPLTDAGAANFARMVRISRLDLSRTRLGNVGLKGIYPLPGLEELWLLGTDVDDEGIEQLPGRSSMRTLSVGSTPATDRGLAQLTKFPGIEFLDVSATGITDGGLAHVASLSALQNLWVSHTRISDAGLAQLTGLRRLKHLSVTGSAVSSAAVRSFMDVRAMLPTGAFSSEDPFSHVIFDDTPFYRRITESPRPPDGTLRRGTVVQFYVNTGGYSQLWAGEDAGYVAVRPEHLRLIPRKPRLKNASAPTPRSETSLPAAKVDELWRSALDDMKEPQSSSSCVRSTLTTADFLSSFPVLGVKHGFALRAYRDWSQDRSGVVWAMPAHVEYPEPSQCKLVWLPFRSHALPRPGDALDDAMEAITGDGSPWSYLCALALQRRLMNFGCTWCATSQPFLTQTELVLGDNPWKSGLADRFQVSPTNVGAWTWRAAMPRWWEPRVEAWENQVVVTMFTVDVPTSICPYWTEVRMYTATFTPGKYRFTFDYQIIATRR